MTGALIDVGALDQAVLMASQNVGALNDYISTAWPVAVIFITVLAMYGLIRFFFDAPMIAIGKLFGSQP